MFPLSIREIFFWPQKFLSAVLESLACLPIFCLIYLLIILGNTVFSSGKTLLESVFPIFFTFFRVQMFFLSSLVSKCFLFLQEYHHWWHQKNYWRIPFWASKTHALVCLWFCSKRTSILITSTLSWKLLWLLRSLSVILAQQHLWRFY